MMSLLLARFNRQTWRQRGTTPIENLRARIGNIALLGWGPCNQEHIDRDRKPGEATVVRPALIEKAATGTEVLDLLLNLQH